MIKCEWKPETREGYINKDIGLGFFGCRGWEKAHGDESPEDYGFKFCPYCGTSLKRKINAHRN